MAQRCMAQKVWWNMGSQDSRLTGCDVTVLKGRVWRPRCETCWTTRRFLLMLLLGLPPLAAPAVLSLFVAVDRSARHPGYLSLRGGSGGVTPLVDRTSSAAHTTAISAIHSADTGVERAGTATTDRNPTTSIRTTNTAPQATSNLEQGTLSQESSAAGQQMPMADDRTAGAAGVEPLPPMQSGKPTAVPRPAPAVLRLGRRKGLIRALKKGFGFIRMQALEGEPSPTDVFFDYADQDATRVKMVHPGASVLFVLNHGPKNMLRAYGVTLEGGGLDDETRNLSLALRQVSVSFSLFLCLCVCHGRAAARGFSLPVGEYRVGVGEGWLGSVRVGYGQLRVDYGWLVSDRP